MAGNFLVEARVLVAGIALTFGGCIAGGETERSGSVGDKLEAERVEVTVERIDRRTPVPRKDVTGLSRPADGYRLVGVLVEVCSGYEAAIGRFDFELETSAGDGRPKHAAKNYDRPFDTVRDECGRGWIVYEIPRESTPTKVRFAFDETGNSRDQSDNVAARFEWDVE